MTRKKRKKISYRKILITLITLILIIIITTISLNIKNIKKTYLSKITGYNKEAINSFLETEAYKDIKNYQYSKTLESIINTKYYNKKYINNYLEIKYIEDKDFFKNLKLLLDKGYNSNDINNIYNKLTKETISLLITNDYIKDITNIISINYFKENNLQRYLNYYQKEQLDIETTMMHVNIGLDNDYYTNIVKIEDQNNIEVLVNKYHKLDNNFIPKDLEKVSYGLGTLTKEARIAFDKMCESALKENIYIYGGSGYRSYNKQLTLYNNYVYQDGKNKADTYSARAGHSEHQTGLAMDILNKKWDYINETDKEFTWLLNNSYKFGFILRYPKNKEKITGYMYEPWHYRYLGTELATEITLANLTYEEYIAKK